jgi:general secretion pathway protein A
MYTDFYRLTDKPFQLSPDARFFFNSHGHKRALSYLLYGLGQGEGFIVITGDVGTGKTTLIAALHGVLEQRRVIYGKVVSTQLGPDDLLRVVAAEFGLPYEEGSKAVLLKAIESFLKGCVDAGRRVVLLVDEAQNLPRKSIEELRMLSNFSYRGKPLLQSFLLGQREFRNVMRSKEFEQLRQRVIAAYHLRPLEQAEIRSYIEHRLKLVGWNNDPIIEDDVYAGIYDFTKGVPRKINVVCDRLLLFGAMEELHVLDKAACQSVFSDMRDEDLADSD